MIQESQFEWKKPLPTPLKIPNSGLHGLKPQPVRSAGPSRPVSQISTSASSVMSGATLARAIMANSFVLSDFRTSGYRSGFSTLTRTDSATLPNGDYPFLNSPYWRERFSIGDSLLSPRSAPPPPVPPVPENAEHVYVPPLISRGSSEPTKRHLCSGSSQSECEDETAVESRPPTSLDNTDVPASRQTSSITEIASTSSTHQERPQAIPGKNGTEIGPERSMSDPTVEPETHRPSRKLQEPAVLGAEVLAPHLMTETLLSSKDIDNVIDYYSSGVTPEPTNGGFRLPFSPITEESSSQLSPPGPYRPDSRNSSEPAVSPDKLFFGADHPLTVGDGKISQFI